MVDLITFDQAIAESKRFTKRHLLLGNGFSIACRPKIFTYGSLFEQADFSSSSRLPNVFDALKTTDFEKVIRTLDDASQAIQYYTDVASIADEMARDASSLKEILIHTVADNHPGIPSEIDDVQFFGCRKFLSHFLGSMNRNGKVYTLNYDLLLYWTLMHDGNPFDSADDLAMNDGFGRDEDTEQEFVNWMGESNADQQRVHYLHGALHLFDAGSELQKYTWINTGLRLLNQAQAAMKENKFPLFVAEGKSEQKLSKIKHSAYLHHSYKSFSRQMEQRNDALFIYGHSLDSNDNHILKRIAKGNVPQVYVGLYGDVTLEVNKKIISAANQLRASRRGRYELHISFFDAASAKVWEL